MSDAQSRADARAKLVRLTDSGVEACRDAVPKLQLLENAALHAIDPADAAAATRALSAFNDVFERELEQA